MANNHAGSILGTVRNYLSDRSNRRTLLWLVLIPTLTPHIAAEEAVEVFRSVSPAVVGIESAASSGTGIVLTQQGLVLTNAHVVAAPLRYTVRAEVVANGKKKTVTYRDVEVTRFHKVHDLALLQLNIKEHPGTLTKCKLAKEKATTGQRVYAIGNPASAGVDLSKTITEGLLSGTDREFDGLKYYQISAPINPGNSGGPMCDSNGTVIGLVTLKSSEVDNVGFAIPMHGIRMDQFVLPKQVPRDVKRSAELIDAGNEMVKRYSLLAKLGRKDSDEALLIRALTYQVFLEAVVKDPDNYSVYVSLSIISRDFGDDAAAKELLLQSMEVSLWPRRSRPYRELGVWGALNDDRKLAEIAWREGVAKYPVLGAQMWEDLAILYKDQRRYIEASEAAAFALFIAAADTRPEVNTAILKFCAAKMTTDADKAKYKKIIQDTPANLAIRVTNAKRHWKEKVPAVTPEFAAFLKSEGSQLDADLYYAAEPKLPVPKVVGRSRNTPSTNTPDSPPPKNQLARFNDLGWGVKSLAFSPDGNVLAAGKQDDAVLMFDLKAKRLRGSVEKLREVGSLTASQFSPDGSALLCGGSRGLIMIWKPDSTGRLSPMGKYAGHSREVTCIDISADGTTVISGDKDKRLRCWNLQTRRDNYSLSETEGDVLACRIVDQVGYACGKKQFIVFDLATGEVKDVRRLERTYHSAASFSTDGRFLAVATGSDIQVYDTNSGRSLAKSKANGVIWTMRFLPEKKQVAVGVSRAVLIWDFGTDKLVQRHPTTRTGSIHNIAISADGKKIAFMASGAKQDLHVRSLEP